MSAVHGVYPRSREGRDFRLMQIHKMKDNLIQYAKDCEIAAQEDVKRTSAASDSKSGSDTDKPLCSEEFEWNVENELLFLNAMMGHKPVGVNKHFSMVIILLKFEELMNRNVESQVLWDRLNTMYNMEMLHDAEVLPFPNADNDFGLPDDDFVDLKKAKLLEEIDLKADATPEVEPVPEPKRELKRELQVYKGMKDIKKDASKDVKESTKTVAEPVAEVVKEVKVEEIEAPPVTPSKRSRPSTPHEKKTTKEAKKDARSTPVSKERKQSLTEKETKPPSKARTPVVKKETPVKDDKSELRKDRVKELTSSGNTKRSTRGSVTDSASNKSASPITTPSNKRKRM